MTLYNRSWSVQKQLYILLPRYFRASYKLWGEALNGAHLYLCLNKYLWACERITRSPYFQGRRGNAYSGGPLLWLVASPVEPATKIPCLKEATG